MARYTKGLEKLAQYRKKQQFLKARRLASNNPKWKDEKYMTPEEYEAYIDRYLVVAEGDFPEESQTKIAVKMYDLKKKYSQGNKNPLDEEV